MEIFLFQIVSVVCKMIVFSYALDTRKIKRLGHKNILPMISKRECHFLRNGNAYWSIYIDLLTFSMFKAK